MSPDAEGGARREPRGRQGAAARGALAAAAVRATASDEGRGAIFRPGGHGPPWHSARDGGGRAPSVVADGELATGKKYGSVRSGPGHVAEPAVTCDVRTATVRTPPRPRAFLTDEADRDPPTAQSAPPAPAPRPGEPPMTNSKTPPDLRRPGVSRRGFLKAGSVVAGSLGVAVGAARAQEAAAPSAAARSVTLTVNGTARHVSAEPRTTLVEALRDALGLTGTKIGCNQGQCGACTVLMDGVRVNSCLTLAVMAEGARIVTVEGLADPTADLHPMQAAFAENDAFQCGYCTPGQILSAIACIDEGHAGDAAEIREYMSGNLCRCGAYPNIVAAIEQVRDSQQG